jgi:hypothetical protein
VDYPKSLPSIGLVGGKFVDEDAVTGTPGSLIPAQWGNAVTDELLVLIAASGLVPDENDNTQLAAAINKIAQKGQVVYALDTGVANVYAASFTPAITALVDGMVLKVKAKTANSGACTFNPNGLGAKAIVGGGHGALQGGEIIANGDVWLQYNSSIGGGSWILVDSTGGALPLAPATKSLHAIQVAQVQAGTGLYAADTGAGSAYTVAYAPVITALTDGMTLHFKALTSNTGASTFSPSGLAAKAIVGLAHAALQGGEIFATGTCTVAYSLTLDKWVLISCSGGATQVAAATQSQHALSLGQANTLYAGLGAVPGQMEWFATMAPPATFLASNGSAVSRATYTNLFNAITAQTTGSVTNGSNSITGVTSPAPASMWVGMPISGPGIPAGATVSAVGASTITLSANATATNAAAALVIAPHGVGDGSTTFNVPDGRGVDFRGWDNGRGMDAGRVFGSYQADQFPVHGHSYGSTAVVQVGSGTTVLQPGTGSSSTTFGAGSGSETRVKNIALLPCIKY